ncbi:MAG: hypothetical protein HWE20_02540 [Gammaproteobacteria bacterium]|nr:hypothetical protein [Gammaproteobacteria bacterium]
MSFRSGALEFKNIHMLSRIVGFLMFFPIAIPNDPFYIIPVLTFLASPFLFSYRFPLYQLTFFIFLCLYITLVNIFSPLGLHEVFASYVGTLATLALLLVRFSNIDVDQFLRGFADSALLYAIYIFFVVFYSGNVDLYTSFSFFKSSNRLWGSEYILGWPNAIACFLVLGAFFMRIRRKTSLAWLILAAALLGGSRVGLLGMLFLAAFDPCESKRLRLAIRLVLLSVVVSLFIGYLYYMDSPFLAGRIFKYSDRLSILNVLLDSFLSRPFGWGNVSFDDIDQGLYYVSFHSSYLKFLVRYGFLGLVFLLVFIVAPLFSRGREMYFLPILFLLFVSIPQDFLFQMNLIFVLSILLKGVAVARLGGLNAKKNTLS